jgi:hypothetical protein
MSFRELAIALRYDPEVRRRFIEAWEKARREHAFAVLGNRRLAKRTNPGHDPPLRLLRHCVFDGDAGLFIGLTVYAGLFYVLGQWLAPLGQWLAQSI